MCLAVSPAAFDLKGLAPASDMGPKMRATDSDADDEDEA